jgi:flavorubredoxin
MDVPIRAAETVEIAPDTHHIRFLAGEGVNPVSMFVNSMVITGDEPVIVDCGPAIVRDAWLDAAFSVVDPADVKWIYLSHDDGDHVGNLLPVLDLCPDATIVSNWFMVERMLGDFGVLPLDRMRWVNDGERFRACGRDLIAVTPPTYDSPTTRGLFDTRTGVYWSADSFGCAVTHEVRELGELDADFWPSVFLQVNAMLSPWHRWLDTAKYQAHLDRIAALDASVVAGAHGPIVTGEQIGAALELFTQLPDKEPNVEPGQAELDAMRAALVAVGAEVAA